MSTLQFTLRLPGDDEGFVGRSCSGKRCGRYFKIQGSDIPAVLHCPYCGIRATTEETHTSDQLAYAKRVLEEKARKYAHDAISKAFQNAFGNLPSDGPISFRPAAPFEERRVSPDYRERTVDTNLSCPDCGFRFKVFGIFGYCPRCRTENGLIYDTNLAIIRREMAATQDQTRALRYAYSDLVSTVEIFCKGKIPARPGEKSRNFQRLADVEQLATERCKQPLSVLLLPYELTALRLVYQKRHIIVHNGGVIDARFAKEMPGHDHLIGQRATLSVSEFDVAARAIQKLIAAVFVAPLN